MQHVFTFLKRTGITTIFKIVAMTVVLRHNRKNVKSQGEETVVENSVFESESTSVQAPRSTRDKYDDNESDTERLENTHYARRQNTALSVHALTTRSLCSAEARALLNMSQWQL